jgi:large subunit ribosomal protein L9
MQVILREDVPGLGIIGDIVKVKPGYARNFLLPRGLAVVADHRNLRQLDHHKRVIALKKSRERGSHEDFARRLSEVVIEIEARAGKGGKLFGSVTNMDVHKLLGERGFELDRRRIELREPIKEVGEYAVSVRVGQDITAKINVAVKPVGGELEQATPDEHLEFDAEPEPKPRRKRGPKHEEAAESSDEPSESESS